MIGLLVTSRPFLFTYFRTKSPSRLWSDIHRPAA
uniref:Uncharacterized protein n=1 Tax=Microviridae sp. ctnRH7 TaxID=2826745 RepID=A0A8S5NKP2_9VIRU|nr:MAG TPA: hypothetical protein [Microviridae sp. ctnRH7]